MNFIIDCFVVANRQVSWSMLRRDFRTGKQCAILDFGLTPRKIFYFCPLTPTTGLIPGVAMHFVIWTWHPFGRYGFEASAANLFFPLSDKVHEYVQRNVQKLSIVPYHKWIQYNPTKSDHNIQDIYRHVTCKIEGPKVCICVCILDGWVGRCGKTLAKHMVLGPYGLNGAQMENVIWFWEVLGYTQQVSQPYPTTITESKITQKNITIFQILPKM